MNVQFAKGAHEVEGVETLPVLARDSRTATGRDGARKPIVSDILDALCERAERRGVAAFCFMNADILLSQAAVDWIARGKHDAWLFSREDFDGATGESRGMGTAGVDVVALKTTWWREHRHRFRPYIAGEAVWDNVYTAIVLCHADAVLENRQPLVRHEAHPIAWGPGSGPFARYTQYLAALDAPYFSLWCRYWDQLQTMRQRTAPEDAERALARDTFVFAPSVGARVIQGLRAVKAGLRYRFR